MSHADATDGIETLYRRPRTNTPAMGPGFVEGLTVDRFPGVGPAAAAKMNRLGIFTALDLRAKDEDFLRTHFGNAGPHDFNICRGIDHRPVCTDRFRKSVGAENTFPRDLSSFDEMKAELEPLVNKVWRYCESTGARGRTVTLKVKFADFQVITRRMSIKKDNYSRGIKGRGRVTPISEPHDTDA